MRFVFLLSVLLLILPRPVSAQVGPIGTATVAFYDIGAAQPFQTPSVLQWANFACGQAKPTATTAPVVNPKALWLDDPANPNNLACIWNDPGTGILFALPIRSAPIESTIVLTTVSNLASPESARSNTFTRPGLPPGVPQGYRVGP